jgi:uncharacterized protein (TIGR00661 family)
LHGIDAETLMKILYGVQGTGNGHISRAKAFAAHPGVEVTWLYSGRPLEALGELPKGSLWRRGMTFVTENGRLKPIKTLLGNSVRGFVRDVRELDLAPYDCVVTDFEPTISWAARLRGIPTVGIGHQYAFDHVVPVAPGQPLGRLVLKAFAPADCGLGLHWHHFDQPILPPIIDLEGQTRQTPVAGKIVVYLPFEDQQGVIAMLRQLPEYEFYLYGPGLMHRSVGNVHTRALSRLGFKADLVSAAGVITNAGFELIAECLALGIKVIAKALVGQVEQASNAAALARLGYAEVVADLSAAALRQWLLRAERVEISYPVVHARIAGWLADGMRESVAALSGELWEDVVISRGAGRMPGRLPARRLTQPLQTISAGSS